MDMFQVVALAISIHTLRVEGDHVKKTVTYDKHLISIHTLRVEGDTLICCFLSRLLLFQSTPSAWRVTIEFLSITNTHIYFNPHPPRGG